MSNPSRWEGDLYVNGNLQSLTQTYPPGSIDDSDVQAGAGIQVTKLEHIHLGKFAQPNTTATTETRTLHVVRGATGTILAFRAGSIGPCAGAATITVDLKKNGSSVLTAVITLNSANTARVAVAGTIASAALVAGDWLEAVITATAGGGTLGTGFFCQVDVQEDPQ